MKKDIKWLKEEIWYSDRNIGLDWKEFVLNLIDQLDEPEVLTQEWIDKNVVHIRGLGDILKSEDVESLIYRNQEITYEDAIKVIAENIDTDEFSVGMYIEALNNNEKYEFLTEKWIEDNTRPVDDEGRLYVWKRDLQNLIAPKQDLPVIPRYVADYIQEGKELGCDLGTAMTVKTELLKGIRDYIKNNEETFARAWLDGYKIEEEPKFYVLDKEDRPLLLRFSQGIMRAPSGLSPIEEIVKNQRNSMQFTEQEIKDCDESLWAFATPVKEVSND